MRYATCWFLINFCDLAFGIIEILVKLRMVLNLDALNRFQSLGFVDVLHCYLDFHDLLSFSTFIIHQVCYGGGVKQ